MRVRQVESNRRFPGRDRELGPAVRILVEGQERWGVSYVTRQNHTKGSMGKDGTMTIAGKDETAGAYALAV
jgi:hypothetical protein